MDEQITDSSYRILTRERSHEEARQTVATNRMLVQSLVIINGCAATAVLAYLGAHNVSGPGKSATILTIVLLLFRGFYCHVRWFLHPANDSRMVKFLGA